ncbi:hypothetical protein [Nocardia sp. CY41]|uniref:hypothetical protein n=1 Tax=Nocardia sp. CY41 TaxID=2608686 RepID=UPI00135AF779|nr:hypothetical protein [Nocardia sp. CY41]
MAVMAPTGDADMVRTLAELLIVLALIYIGAAAVGRQQATWTVFLVLGVVFALLRLQDWVPPYAALTVLAANLLGWLAASRGFDSTVRVLAVATAGFATAAIIAVEVGGNVARFVVAAGWIAHSGWDCVHYHSNRTVARSFAEFCAIVDLFVGIAVLAFG